MTTYSYTSVISYSISQHLHGKVSAPDPLKDETVSGHILYVGGKHGVLVAQGAGNAGQSCRAAFSM
jgi:hypothetical protein